MTKIIVLKEPCQPSSKRIKENRETLYSTFFILCGRQRFSELTGYLLTEFAADRGDQVNEKDDDVFQIRPTNLSNDRELIFKRNVYIAASKLEARKHDILKHNEVLFNLEGSFFVPIMSHGSALRSAILMQHTLPTSRTFTRDEKSAPNFARIGITNQGR